MFFASMNPRCRVEWSQTVELRRAKSHLIALLRQLIQSAVLVGALERRGEEDQLLVRNSRVGLLVRRPLLVWGRNELD